MGDESTNPPPVAPPPVAAAVVPVPDTPPPAPSNDAADSPKKIHININHIIAIVTYILSTPLLGYGVWLLWTRDTACEDVIHDAPAQFRMMCGITLIVIFVASCLFTYYGSRTIYLGVISLVILLIGTLILGIVFLGSFPMESRGVAFAPMWMRTRIEDGDAWVGIKDCIYKTKICHNLAYENIELSAEEFMQKNLSPIQNGCCKPSYLCGMLYVNATYWNPPPEDKYSSNNGVIVPGASAMYGEVPKNTSVNPKTYGDCQAYSNVDTRLCYDCHSCKEGFLKSVRKHRKKDGTFFIAMSVVLLAIHTIRFIISMMDNRSSSKDMA